MRLAGKGVRPLNSISHEQRMTGTTALVRARSSGDRMTAQGFFLFCSHECLPVAERKGQASSDKWHLCQIKPSASGMIGRLNMDGPRGWNASSVKVRAGRPNLETETGVWRFIDSHVRPNAAGSSLVTPVHGKGATPRGAEVGVPVCGGMWKRAAGMVSWSMSGGQRARW